ncbi:MAG: ABC transporter ATP-binding protein [Desulfobacterales bacterium]
MKPLIQAVAISKQYHLPRRTITVLRDINFFVGQNEFVAIMGPSGSGKSTLLHILGCLDRPSAGEYRFDGIDVFNASDRLLSQFRAQDIGFVFQTFNLVGTLTVYENVELPFVYAMFPRKEMAARVNRAVEQVGLADRIHHRPSELSGGEMQRVAIARAMAMQPKLLLADEPTGNLDTATSLEILKLFQEFHALGVTLVMVTHDPEIARLAQRVVVLKDGALCDQDTVNPVPAGDLFPLAKAVS